MTRAVRLGPEATVLWDANYEPTRSRLVGQAKRVAKVYEATVVLVGDDGVERHREVPPSPRPRRDTIRIW